ncbi:hypothetical protein GN330_21905 [Nitratireductor sp. CAU 1489]|uniref:Uncharacterized protein n=1 Tax=Nitratireductor arenosus TaxID=2682096 RepID=A0A844QQ13_9HYPH|nr:hypothetical protein [Nitratireductor arenosus]MVA99911.1 hypothetical protein [Nitratireductor arenosus]
MTVTVTPFLRNALYLDAVVSGAAAVLMAGGAGLLSPLLGLPQPLLLWAGLVLFPFVAMLVFAARRERIAHLLMIDIVALNALWVAASFGMLIAGLVEPNLLGIAFVVAQALAVTAFAVLQVASLRAAGAQGA